MVVGQRQRVPLLASRFCAGHTYTGDTLTSGLALARIRYCAASGAPADISSTPKKQECAAMAANRAPRKPGAADDRSSSSRPTKAAPGKPATAPKKTAAGRPAAQGRGGATAVKRRPGKSIVSKKQPPWGLIVASVVVVAFAIGVVAFAVTRNNSSNSASKSSSSSLTDPKNAPYVQPEVPAATAITGLTHTVEPDHDHVTAPVKYNASPPIGGDHSYVWVDCTGTVYPQAIANENAVHGLEHGAVWITYRPGLAASQVSTLAALVTGQNYTFMSPFPGLKSPISVQAWGYQLAVDSASDPRIKQFIGALRNTPKVSPEYPGQCSQPTFKAKPSTFGNPIFPSG